MSAFHHARHASHVQGNGPSDLGNRSTIVQLENITSFSATMHETPFLSTFDEQPRHVVDIFSGTSNVEKTLDIEEFAQNRRDNLQIAFELARRNLTERADKQA